MKSLKKVFAAAVLSGAVAIPSVFAAPATDNQAATRFDDTELFIKSQSQPSLLMPTNDVKIQTTPWDSVTVDLFELESFLSAYDWLHNNDDPAEVKKIIEDYKNTLPADANKDGEPKTLSFHELPQDIQTKLTNAYEMYLKQGNNRPKSLDATMFRTFVRTFELMKEDYVESATDREILRSAVEGMVAMRTDSLLNEGTKAETNMTTLIESAMRGMGKRDPHSRYLDPKELQELRSQTSGSFGGLGIQIRPAADGSGVLVVKPMDDSPAKGAGVQKGDIITGIAEKGGEEISFEGYTLEQAVEKMKGKPGTEVTITIKRDGVMQPLKLDMARDIIRDNPVSVKVVGDVVVLSVSSFTQQTTHKLTEAIQNTKAEDGSEPRAYVLDLTNDPGGLLNEAVTVSDLFLEQGKIVSVKGRDQNPQGAYSAYKGDIINGKPLVVMVNTGSASASEIVAGALQDHKRAKIVGVRTFGKGSVQSIIPLPNGGALRMTTGRYYTPSDHSIQGLGINPNVKVDVEWLKNLDESEIRREASLEGSIQNLDDEATRSTLTKTTELCVVHQKEYSIKDDFNKLGVDTDLFYGPAGEPLRFKKDEEGKYTLDMDKGDLHLVNEIMACAVEEAAKVEKLTDREPVPAKPAAAPKPTQ